MTDFNIHVTLTDAQIAEIAGTVAAETLANTKTILDQLGALMTDQSNIDAETQAIETAVTAENASLTDIANQVAALDTAFTQYAQAHPELNLSGLQAAVTSLGQTVQTAQTTDTTAQGDVAAEPGQTTTPTPPPTTP